MTPPFAERVAARLAHARSMKSGPAKWLAALDFWVVVVFVALVRTLRGWRRSSVEASGAISMSRYKSVVRGVASQRDPWSTRGKFETHVGVLRETAAAAARWRARGRRPPTYLEDLVFRAAYDRRRTDRLRRLPGHSIPVARRGLRSARSSRSSRARRRTSSAGRSPDRPRLSDDDDPLAPPESGRHGVLRGAA